MTEHPKRLSIERSCILTMLLLLSLFAAPFACNHQDAASAGDNPSTSSATTVYFQTRHKSRLQTRYKSRFKTDHRQMVRPAICKIRSGQLHRLWRFRQRQAKSKRQRQNHGQVCRALWPAVQRLAHRRRQLLRQNENLDNWRFRRSSKTCTMPNASTSPTMLPAAIMILKRLTTAKPRSSWSRNTQPFIPIHAGNILPAGIAWIFRKGLKKHRHRPHARQQHAAHDSRPVGRRKTMDRPAARPIHRALENHLRPSPVFFQRQSRR